VDLSKGKAFPDLLRIPRRISW